MKTRSAFRFNGWSVAAWMAGAGAAILSAGCSASSLIPEPKADPTRFFVLSAPSLGASVEGRASEGPTVRVRDIEVASYLRTRPLIVRRSDNELQFREFARWGEPIEQGVARVLREELLARGAREVLVRSHARGAGVAADFELTVRVLACEGEADGGVNFRAVWELERADQKTGAESAKAVSGDFRASGLRWDGRNEATLAARLSEAMGGLAAEIAAAMANK